MIQTFEKLNNDKILLLRNSGKQQMECLSGNMIHNVLIIFTEKKRSNDVLNPRDVSSAVSYLRIVPTYYTILNCWNIYYAEKVTICSLCSGKRGNSKYG